MDTGDDVVAVFGEAVAVALRDMAGAEAVVSGSRRTADLPAPAVSAVVRLSGAGEGYCALVAPPETARELARRVYADVGVEPDEGLVRDCIGEVANVVAGQAKTLLFGTPRHFTLSPPTSAAGPPDLPDEERTVVEFVSEAGPFALHLRVPG